jgi:polyisoprenoid-binding protein YceI
MRPRIPPPRRLLLAALAACVLALSACAELRSALRVQDSSLASVPAGTYQLDPEHCSVVFSVDHLGFSRPVMRFDRVQATLRWPAGGAPEASVEARVRTDSVDTNVPLLDRELRSPAMLDAARHPYLRLRAQGWHPTSARRGDVTGMLMLGRERVPLVLHVRFNGYGVDPVTGTPTLGFSARGSFSRDQLGLKAWPGLVGDTVHLRIEAEFLAAPPGSGTG